MNNKQKLAKRLEESGISNLDGLAFATIADCFAYQTNACKDNGFDSCDMWGDYIIMKCFGDGVVYKTVYTRDSDNRRKVVQVVHQSTEYASDIIEQYSMLQVLKKRGL